jgi:hypothetical protein
MACSRRRNGRGGPESIPDASFEPVSAKRSPAILEFINVTRSISWNLAQK